MKKFLMFLSWPIKAAAFVLIALGLILVAVRVFITNGHKGLSDLELLIDVHTLAIDTIIKTLDKRKENETTNS